MEKNEVSASIFKALGHPLRVGIVRELLKGEKCVGDRKPFQGQSGECLAEPQHPEDQRNSKK
jgi:DNA-binding transcriptional ArsR family regulator